MLLDNRALAILGFCHFRLIEAQEQKHERSSRTILDTKEDEEFANELGDKIIKFCEKTRATKKGIEDRLGLFPELIPYYEFTVDYYRSKIKDGTTHIPFLFVLGVVRELNECGLINLNLEYDKALTLFEKAKEFNKTTAPSRLDPNKMIADRSELRKYNDMAREVLEGVWKLSTEFKTKRKRSKRKKRR